MKTMYRILLKIAVVCVIIIPLWRIFQYFFQKLNITFNGYIGKNYNLFDGGSFDKQNFYKIISVIFYWTILLVSIRIGEKIGNKFFPKAGKTTSSR